MQAVDTSLLVRALTRDDSRQSPAAEAFIRDQAPVWISHVVLVETIRVLESVYGCTKPQLIEAMTRIVDNKDLFLEEPSIVRAALALYQTEKKVHFEDCITLESARKAGHLPLATFDKALGRLEGAHLVP
jgi:predicted nucleic-acid-binding protein